MNTRHVELNGEKHPIILSTYVLAQVGEKYSLNLEELFSMLSENRLSLLKLYDLFFFGLKAGYKKESKESPFKTVEECAEYLDESGYEWMQKIIELFADFMPTPKEEGKKSVKKKLVKSG